MQGSCHCGAIRFEAPEPAEMTECNCSYCDRVGALWGYCDPGEFRLLTPESAVSTYRFATGRVEHHHCATCGSATHQHSPDFSSGEADMSVIKLGYNVRMAHDFDRAGIAVRSLDGRSY
jgi:hypothetical protein